MKSVYEQNPRPYTDTARSGHKEQPTDPGSRIGAGTPRQSGPGCKGDADATPRNAVQGGPPEGINYDRKVRTSGRKIIATSPERARKEGKYNEET